MVAIEIVVGAVLGLALIGLGLVFARRRTLGRHGNLIVAAVRPSPSARWRLGLLKLGRDRLEWHALFGWRVAPKRAWRRHGLLLDVPQELADEQISGVLPDATAVRCRAAEGEFELALQPAAYTALRSWGESSPPGIDVNVA